MKVQCPLELNDEGVNKFLGGAPGEWSTYIERGELTLVRWGVVRTTRIIREIGRKIDFGKLLLFHMAEEIRIYAGGHCDY